MDGNLEQPQQLNGETPMTDTLKTPLEQPEVSTYTSTTEPISEPPLSMGTENNVQPVVEPQNPSFVSENIETAQKGNNSIEDALARLTKSDEELTQQQAELDRQRALINKMREQLQDPEIKAVINFVSNGEMPTTIDTHPLSSEPGTQVTNTTPETTVNPSDSATLPPYPINS